MGKRVSFYRWQGNNIKIQILIKQWHKFVLLCVYVCVHCAVQCSHFFFIASFVTDLFANVCNGIMVWVAFQMAAHAWRRKISLPFSLYFMHHHHFLQTKYTFFFLEIRYTQVINFIRIESVRIIKTPLWVRINLQHDVVFIVWSCSIFTQVSGLLVDSIGPVHKVQFLFLICMPLIWQKWCKNALKFVCIFKCNSQKTSIR